MQRNYPLHFFHLLVTVNQRKEFFANYNYKQFLLILFVLSQLGANTWSSNFLFKENNFDVN